MEYLRVVRFRPYRKGMGPVFKLQTWDTGRTTSDYNKACLGYRLSMYDSNAVCKVGKPFTWTVLFEGEDFGCSPCHAIDSDDCLESIMGFLTLRPGDTDREYFQNYTREQLEYCSQHAEALSCEVQNRFGHEGE